MTHGRWKVLWKKKSAGFDKSSIEQWLTHGVEAELAPERKAWYRGLRLAPAVSWEQCNAVLGHTDAHLAKDTVPFAFSKIMKRETLALVCPSAGLTTYPLFPYSSPSLPFF